MDMKRVMNACAPWQNHCKLTPPTIRKLLSAAVPVQMEKRSGGELTLPFHTGALLDGSGPAGVTTLAQANFEHAVLRKFRDSDDLSKVVFRRRFATDRAARTGQVLAREDLPRLHAFGARLAHEVADEFDRVLQRIEIGIIETLAIPEIHEVDLRRITRVGRAQPNAARVPRVRLENDPGEALPGFRTPSCLRIIECIAWEFNG